MTLDVARIQLSEEQRIKLQVAYNELNTRNDDTSPGDQNPMEYLKNRYEDLREIGKKILDDTQLKALADFNQNEHIILEIDNAPTLNPMPPNPSARRERYSGVTQSQGRLATQPVDFTTLVMMASAGVTTYVWAYNPLDVMPRGEEFVRPIEAHQDEIPVRVLNGKNGNPDAETKFAVQSELKYETLISQGVLTEREVVVLQKEIFDDPHQEGEKIRAIIGAGLNTDLFDLERPVLDVSDDTREIQEAFDKAKSYYNSHVKSFTMDRGKTVLWRDNIDINHWRTGYKPIEAPEARRWITTINGQFREGEIER